MAETFHFSYKGVEYDASEYAPKHPGGLAFLRNMKEIAKDFTEYFRYAHDYSEPYILTTQKKYLKVSESSTSKHPPSTQKNTWRFIKKWKISIPLYGPLKSYSFFS